MSIDFKKAYFAIVSVVSVIVIGFAVVELFTVVVNAVWPELAAADLQRLRDLSDSENRMNNYLINRIQPLNTETLNNIIRLCVFSALLWWHLPYLLKQEK